jgi:hypothetical protein
MALWSLPSSILREGATCVVTLMLRHMLQAEMNHVLVATPGSSLLPLAPPIAVARPPRSPNTAPVSTCEASSTCEPASTLPFATLLTQTAVKGGISASPACHMEDSAAIKNVPAAPQVVPLRAASWLSAGETISGISVTPPHSDVSRAPHSVGVTRRELPQLPVSAPIGMRQSLCKRLHTPANGTIDMLATDELLGGSITSGTLDTEPVPRQPLLAAFPTLASRPDSFSTLTQTTGGARNAQQGLNAGWGASCNTTAAATAALPSYSMGLPASEARCSSTGEDTGAVSENKYLQRLHWPPTKSIVQERKWLHQAIQDTLDTSACSSGTLGGSRERSRGSGPGALQDAHSAFDTLSSLRRNRKLGGLAFGEDDELPAPDPVGAALTGTAKAAHSTEGTHTGVLQLLVCREVFHFWYISVIYTLYCKLLSHSLPRACCRKQGPRSMSYSPTERNSTRTVSEGAVQSASVAHCWLTLSCRHHDCRLGGRRNAAIFCSVQAGPSFTVLLMHPCTLPTLATLEHLTVAITLGSLRYPSGISFQHV